MKDLCALSSLKSLIGLNSFQHPRCRYRCRCHAELVSASSTKNFYFLLKGGESNKMKKIALGLLAAIVFALSATFLIPQSFAAATPPTEGAVLYGCSTNGQTYGKSSACTRACKATTPAGFCNQTVVIGPTYVLSLITKYTQWFVAIVGSLAVIMIIIGGFKFIFAKGDSDKVKDARNMIIYAFIGLAVILLAGGAMWTVLRFLTTK